jgi:hypothetical protein
MMDSNRDYLITLMNSNRHFYGNSAHWMSTLSGMDENGKVETL